MDIAKKLNRNYDSVRTRIEKLKATGTSKKYLKNFDYIEDCKIIDAAIKNLSQSQSLEKTVIPDLKTLAASLNRSKTSINSRWHRKLRVWLLRYFNKTLDLEIRPMLAKLLADNFDSIAEIDWKSIAKYPEFAGYTEASLRTFFFSSLSQKAARRLNIDTFDITLKQIAEDAEANYNHPRIIKKTEQRKRDIIEYFENAVNRVNIKDFV